MEPRIYPPWELQPFEELGPDLRPAVGAVRKDPPPPDSLNRALQRAEEIPVMNPIRPSRPPRKFWVPALAVAASLLLIAGVCALFASIQDGGERESDQQASLILLDRSESRTDEDRRAVFVDAIGVTIDREKAGLSGATVEEDVEFLPLKSINPNVPLKIRDVASVPKVRSKSSEPSVEELRAELRALQQKRNEARKHLESVEKTLRVVSRGVSEDDRRGAELAWHRSIYEEQAKARALKKAERERNGQYDNDQILAKMKDLIAKQERVRAQTEQDRKVPYTVCKQVPSKTDVRVQIEPPSAERLFHLESEKQWRERVQPKLAPKDPKNPQGGQGLPGAEGPQTEAYSHFVDNPFQSVIQDPLSTFATTVDTASYSNVRRFLVQEKRLPPRDAVRVAELINYFPYNYAGPKREHPLAVALDMVECPWQRQHHLLRVGLKGREIDPNQLPARNFVFLIDTSGSMNQPNRLPLLKKSLTLLVEQLTPRDRVALVAYAGSAGLVLPSTAGQEKAKILAALDRLSAGGSTNGGDGIVLAYKEAEANLIRDGLNRVILGTDGDFNVGVTSEGELVRLIEEKKKSGVFLSILGFGMGNVKDSTMERLAYHGNGHYAYIDSEAEARKVFVEQGASLVAIAKDVKLQLEFNPLRVAGYRLIGYENRLLRAEDFNDDTRHGGSMGAGHTVTALYEIVPAGVPLPVTGGTRQVDPLKYQKPAQPSVRADSGDWLTVKLRYKDPDADSSKLLEIPLAGGVTRLAEASEDVRFATAVAGFGMLLRKSEHGGNLTYPAVRELAGKALGKDPGGHRAGFLELIESAAALERASEQK